jgi:hydroxymethylglutaryl-CoA reductase (NADPH)
LTTSDLVVGGVSRAVSSISVDDPVPFSLRTELEVRVDGPVLVEGPHTIASEFVGDPFGTLEFEAVDYIVQLPAERPHIPRREDDWSPGAVRERRDFVRDATGVKLERVARISYDTELTHGNIEHPIGTAQVPLGIAGPLRINGEHAEGEFLIRLATTEGMLVASRNRLESPQRSRRRYVHGSGRLDAACPRLHLESVREARDFTQWLQQKVSRIGEVVESTTSVGKILRIETHVAHRFAFCRFDYTTGDAADQNMASMATFVAT